jgi:TPR repeat protein
VKEAWLGMALVFLCSIPAVAFSSDDLCRVTYLHADKSPEIRACEAAANAGDANAELGYGLVLWSGDQPAHDRRAALEWIRKSARQGHFVAQISLGGLLAHKDVEPELRNPVEAYAWLVASGGNQGARRLRATFNQTDVATADRMASDYKAKYAPLQASRAGWWLRATDLLSRIWPGLVVLGFFLAARRCLTRKLLFVVIGIVIAYASQYLALWVLALAMNAVMMRFPDQMLNAALWTFGLAFLVSLLAPTLGVWALHQFWLRKRRDLASAT